ncbi:MAG: cobyrinate a,c-diamide synthase [Pseudomonadota bacterium]
MNGFMIAAPQSGSGKTVMTLGILRALKESGVPVASAKAGPDYIDPAFHMAATGEPCMNLDPWAMRRELLLKLATAQGQGRTLVVEAMMGLFDGAVDDTGSAADLASLLGLPIVLVIDASRMGQSVAALVSGFQNHRTDLSIAGVILNRVGSERHHAMLARALQQLNVPILGVVPSDARLSLPSRHLGLVQASENKGLETFVAEAARLVESHCDLTRLAAMEAEVPTPSAATRLPPLGQTMAIARDQAFSFCYPHLLAGWHAQGATLTFFSPLADEAPAEGADAVFLPGGYPELNAQRLAGAHHFRGGMESMAEKGALIYGECGGYMVLGDALVDAEGDAHKMLGLLPVTTSFAERKRHLGYRKLTSSAVPGWECNLRGHEFHYTSIAQVGNAQPLFHAHDAGDVDLGSVGQRVGQVMGSYMHVIDWVE